MYAFFLKFLKRLLSSASVAAPDRVDSHGIKHRTDIDGLRAVAVLPVVAFHAGITLVPGGFVGVDVFFVISGYLISGLLLKDMDNQRFSILKFYERRIRRIFPALIATLLGTFMIAWVYSLPGELVSLSKSALAALASVSNIYFWLKTGYFDGSAHSEPLLHTWSLAVEEQFYIFWPLFLMAMYRFGRKPTVWLTCGIFVASFIVSAIGAFTFKDASYYLVHTRGWELLLGGLVAMNVVRTPQAGWLRETIAIVALLSIVLSVFFINGDMPFPGALALPPTLGAAALIWVGTHPQSTLVGRLLALKPVVFIGLISYSMYLWHWPIAVFQRNSSLLISVGPDWLRKLAIIGASMIAAYLSWRFVEQPFRAGPHKPSPRRLAWMALAASAVIAVISATFWLWQGAPGRFTQQQLQTAHYLKFDPAPMFRDGVCFLRERIGAPTVAPECLQADAARTTYLLLGDSHAAQLWSGLATQAPDKHFMQLTAVGCLPTRTGALGEVQRCRDAFNIGFDQVVSRPDIHSVIIAGRWTHGSVERVAATLDWLKQHNISTILVGPSVVYDIALPRLLVKQQRNPADDANQYQDRSLYGLDQQMSALAAAKGARYFSLINAACQAGHCVTQTGDVPFVFDREHYTDRGSAFIADKLIEAGVL